MARLQRRWPYNTQEWKTLRHVLVYGHSEGCSMCGTMRGRMDLHHDPPITDHEREERSEDVFNPDRLIVLCVGCHSGVTNGVDLGEIRRRAKWRELIHEGELQHVDFS